MCVVSAGQAYRPQLERLYASLPKGVGLSVLSDLEQGPVSGDHVFWHPLTRPTVHPIHGRFDWRLKAVALQCGFGVAAVRSTTRFLYLDGDCYFADPSLSVRDIVAPRGADIVTLSQRHRLADDTLFTYSAQMRAFIAAQGAPELRAALLRAHLPLEQAILIQRLTPRTRALPEWWLRIADLGQAEGMHGDPDAVDYGLALELCGAPYVEADSGTAWLRGIHFTNRGAIFTLAHERVFDSSGRSPESVDALIRCDAPDRPWRFDTLTSQEWAVLLAVARDERVAPQVYRAIGAAPSVPAAVRHALRDSYRETAAHVARLRAVLAEVLATLHQAGIRVVVLKGAALTVDVRTDIGLRPWSDLDLLVDRHDAPAVVEALTGLGFRSGRAETTTGATLAHENELLLVGPTGCHVDLHWALFDSPFYQTRTAAGALWAYTRPVRIAGAPALALTPEWQLLHLCGHLVLHHRGDELLWLSDIAALTMRYRESLQWEVVCAEAQRLDLVIALQRTVSAVVDRLAAPIPDEAREAIAALRPSPHEEAVVSRLRDRRRSMAAQLAFDLRSMRSWRDRLAFARTRLFPSVDYMRLRYGVRSPWGLVFAYPYRWLIGLRRGATGGR